MSWLPKVIVPGQALGGQGFFGAYTALAAGVSTKVLMPAGMGWVLCDAHTTIQITSDGGTTFETMIAASAGGLYISDGANVYAVGDATGGSVHYSQIN